MNFKAGGATPLHIASDIGNPEIINCLLQAGADPNATEDEVMLLELCMPKFFHLIITVKCEL